ncbi:MAG TPA: peptide chain release factor N(5)-glutamine methyltransferase [Rubrivivax sp.]|nr:peptide chain release factor N(5)-glutamine methyltransferase [Rubrivivax sp.]
MSIAEALARARALGLDRLDAQLLLSRVLQQPRPWLIAHAERALTPPQQQAFERACRRRADDEPLAYLLGEREFHGLMLQVAPAVLVPRVDTETLVDWALELLAAMCAPQVADLGTGSGAIALALKHRTPAASVCAVELSAAALEVARANAARLGLDLELLQGDWWQPLQGRRFDLVVSNPPYIDGDDPHLAALRHEPVLALTPGADGMTALSAIVRDAPAHLREGGWLLLEHGHQQAEAACGLLRAAGFSDIATRADLAGRPRCSGGRWPTRG